jgi:hypothetical protein
MRTYPALVACGITGVIAIVGSEEEEAKFHTDGIKTVLWSMALIPVGILTALWFLA